MLVYYLGRNYLGGLGFLYLGCALCLAGTYGIYSRNASLLFRERENAGFAQRNSMLERSMHLQQVQYTALANQVEETRLARHDLRQHQRVIEQFLRDGDREKLKEYISGSYENNDGAFRWLTVCAHPAVDALIRYYIELMQKEDAKLDIVINLQEDVPIPAHDLCIVMGNCLENALEAIREAEPKQRFLRLRGEQDDDTFTLVVGNGFSGQRQMEKGEFLSTKRGSQPGFGLSSIRAVAEKYDGTCRAEAENGEFRLFVVLFGKRGDS